MRLGCLIAIKIVFFVTIHSFASNRLMSINSDDLKRLSQNTFRMSVDRNKNIRFDGQWPEVCGDSVTVESSHSQSNLNVTMSVDLNCYELLLKPIETIAQSPKSSMRKILVKGVVRPKEKVVLTSVRPTLDLSLPTKYVDSAMREHQTNLDESSASIILDSKYGSASQRSRLEGGLTYRRCNPDDYGTNNPSVCNDRYGLDLNADIKLNDSTSLRGTTQLDLQNQPGDSLSGKTGIRLDILFQFDEAPK